MWLSRRLAAILLLLGKSAGKCISFVRKTAPSQLLMPSEWMLMLLLLLMVMVMGQWDCQCDSDSNWIGLGNAIAREQIE